jgi:hypothetical protein
VPHVRAANFSVNLPILTISETALTKSKTKQMGEDSSFLPSLSENSLPSPSENRPPSLSERPSESFSEKNITSLSEGKNPPNENSGSVEIWL